MNIPKYWAKKIGSAVEHQDRKFALSCWQWSNTSQEDAEQKADIKIKELNGKFLAGRQLDRYLYGDRPMREEILKVIKNRSGQEIAILTRNSYGAQILNTINAMFIDIEFVPESQMEMLGRRFNNWLGQSSASQEELYLEQIEAWSKQHPYIAMRVYRTFAGLRCLVTNDLFDPRDQNAIQIQRSLGSDPLYIRLCQAQESFRARLTPKPWRCGVGQPPSKYPWESDQEEIRYRQWESDYAARSSKYMTCRLVREIGGSSRHPEIEAVLDLHDEIARTDSNQPLA